LLYIIKYSKNHAKKQWIKESAETVRNIIQNNSKTTLYNKKILGVEKSVDKFVENKIYCLRYKWLEYK